MSDVGEFRFQDVCDAIAGAWERYRDEIFAKTRGVSDWLVERLDPQAGQTVLELTAGPGETGFLVAERVGPGGTLISTDISQGMIDAARRGGEARGLTNVEYRIMDAQEIHLPDGSVDGVLSRFGVMLLPEPGRCLAEVRRVLSPGGRLAYAVWGAPDRNPWLTSIAMALVSRGHNPGGDPFGPGGPFSLAAPDANRDLLKAAGFGEPGVGEIEGTMAFPTVDAYWEMQSAIAGPVATLIASVPEDERRAIRDALEPMLEPFRVGEGLELPWMAVGVSAG